MRQAFAGMLWSKQLYDYDVARWLDGDPTQPAPPDVAARRPQRPLAQLRRLRHHVDARQVGVPLVRGLGPRRSTASRWPTSTRRSPSTSCCCSAGSGSSTPTARCPPTSGTSATSTRRCRRGRRSRCSPSTAAATSTSSARCSTSCWSTSPGGSTARTPTGRTCSRAASSGWTTSARSTARTCRSAGRSSSPTPPAGWRSTRWRWRTIARDPATAPASGRPTDLVLKFLEHFAAIREAMDDSRACGTTPTACSTTGSSRPTARRCRCKVALDGRHHPAARRRRRRRADARPGRAPSASGSPRFLDRRRHATIREKLAEAGLLRGEPGHRRLLLGVVGVDRLERLFDKLFDPRRVPLAVRAAGAVRVPPRAPVRARRRRRSRRRSTTSRPSRPPRCSAATPTGAGPLWFPLNYLVDQRARALPPLLRRRLHRRVPDRVRAAS